MPSAKQSLQSSAAGFSPAVGQAIKLGAAAPTGQARKAKEARIARASCDVITSNLVAPKAMIDDLTTIIKDMADQGIALSNPTVGFMDRDGRFEVTLGIEVVEGHKTSARRKVKLRKVHKVHNNRAVKTHKNWRTIINTAGPSIAFQSKPASFVLKFKDGPSGDFLKAVGLNNAPESDTLSRCLAAFEYGIRTKGNRLLPSRAIALIRSVDGIAKGQKDKEAISFAKNKAIVDSFLQPVQSSTRLSKYHQSLLQVPEASEVGADKIINGTKAALQQLVASKVLTEESIIRLGRDRFHVGKLIKSLDKAGRVVLAADIAAKVTNALVDGRPDEALNAVVTAFVTVAAGAVVTAVVGPFVGFGVSLAINSYFEKNGGMYGVIELAIVGTRGIIGRVEEKVHMLTVEALQITDSDGVTLSKALANPRRVFGL